jgi:flagellar biosynthetic protein FliQ
MTVEMVLDVLREAFLRILAISGPALLVGMLVGLVISIFQATTQIQEQTLSFVPKLLAIFLTLILAGNFMLNLLLNFTEMIFKMISAM